MYPVALPPSLMVPNGVLQLLPWLVEVITGSAEGVEVGSVYIVAPAAPFAGAALSPEMSES